jgi:hypothetical protein
MLKSLTLVFLILLSITVDAAQFIAPGPDDNIRYTGRWDRTNNGQPWAYAKGTSLIANFHGTGISATFSDTSTDYLRIIIDDAASESIKIQVSSGAFSYELASGLDDSLHKIEIVKETDAGRWSFHGFDIEGTDVEDEPVELLRKLVFYGDSNLAGDSLEHEQNQSARSLRGSYYGFAGIVSRMFDAQYSNISRSGASIRSLHTSFDRIDWFTPGLLWDLSVDPPAAVIINIGANDVGRPKRKIKKDYHSLLDDMRAAYPDAHIVLYNGWGWDYDEPANYTHEVIAERGEYSNMSSDIFPWLFEQWHGSEYDHSGMAHQLARHLSTKLDGWVPAEADVMNGFGLDGDVANGSFEEVAPFGGYGWRYYTDSGVSRVHDPDGAHDGDYYLRLMNGAASHQPNPALDNETFTVTAWMRGANNDARIHMTIDFRGQHIWTDPLDSTTVTKNLTTEWKQYDITATAPSNMEDPVFQTRLTFQAATDYSVDIDNVVMSFGNEPDLCTDDDGDGYGNPGSSDCTNGAETDCRDNDASVNPSATEICGNGVDDDCNTSTPDSGGNACPACALIGESCRNNSDCCAGSCSKGKPADRVCW